MSSPTDPLVSIEDATIVGADPWLTTRLDHPEDVAVADDGRLYAGGERGQLYCINPETNEVRELASTEGFILGVELGPEGDLYACDFQRHAVFRLPLSEGSPSGELSVVVSGGPDTPPWHPNYAVFDADGRLYVSDSGDRSDMENAGGCIYGVDTNGEGYIVTDELDAFPNGMALSKSGTELYVAETGTHEISVIHLNEGRATDVEQLDIDFGLVDGLALDNDDVLYAASIGDNAVYRYHEGRVETVVVDPDGLVIGNPTNLAFGGSDFSTLYIANLGLWHLTTIECDVTGRHPTGRGQITD